MVRVAIAGAAGRMGRSLVKAVNQSDVALQVTAATVLADDPCLGVDVGSMAMGVASGVVTVSDLTSASDFDVLIDFTAPAATLKLLSFANSIARLWLSVLLVYRPQGLRLYLLQANRSRWCLLLI